MKRYDPKTLEPKWQKRWAADKLYAAVDFDATRPKYTMLTEFPYPSGDGLHIGHVREYSLADAVARYKRMTGHNVLYPMGYDAFGLPTENYAIKHKIAPQAATEHNIANFQKQFDSLGLSIDWSRSFRTTDPDYYKWTQWLFLQFYKHDLAYQAEVDINWCPHCKTGLSNEEVVNGRHERCDTLVEKKTLKQWILRITKYADRLIDGLANVDYPSRIADQQINWIGRSQGAEVDFKIGSRKLTVFTTRADTIFSGAFLVLAPEHPLVDKLTTDEQKQAVRDYVIATQAKSEIDRQDDKKEKTGVFTGSYAVNPANDEKIPVWIADFVLAGYGTGAVFGDIHDERDFEFLNKYDIPAKVTVVPEDAKEAQKVKDKEYAYTSEGILIDSGHFSGQPSAEARDKIIAWLAEKGAARERVNYRLRDWIFSRQHYWGEPIPIIHCAKDGAVPVPEKDLPVVLPEVKNYEPTDTGQSPLAAIADWVNVKCPKCGGPAKRETDTMPNWAGSSWYYLRYYDAHNDQVFADPKKLKYWGEVDMYLGGMEHTTLHLLYSRFWHQFLYDQGLVPTPEPYHARRGQGIILAADGTKMSKSKGNVVNPNEVLEAGYGADALRLAIAFLAPYDQTTPWSPETVGGTFRFVQRVWTLVQEFEEAKPGTADDRALLVATHRAIKKVSRDIDKLNFNTAVSALMEFTNQLYKLKQSDGFKAGPCWQFALESLTQLLAPLAPHICEEIWQQLGHEHSVHVSAWPTWDDKFLASDTMTIVVQVNGKVRAQLDLPADSTEKAVLASARKDHKVDSYVADKEIIKTIYVPAKLVSFVVK
ncbi:MAG: leucine--tRNA ligase [Candidatus Saccharimonadales bacterium]